MIPVQLFHEVKRGDAFVSADAYELTAPQDIHFSEIGPSRNTTVGCVIRDSKLNVNKSPAGLGNFLGWDRRTSEVALYESAWLFTVAPQADLVNPVLKPMELTWGCITASGVPADERHYLCRARHWDT